MTKYIVYYNKEFNEYTSWKEAEDFINAHQGCRFKKVSSKKEEDALRKKWDGLDNFVNKIYVAVLGSQIKRFDSWKECDEFIKKNPNAKYKSFVDDSEAQDYINSSAKTSVPLDLQDTLYCYLGYHSEPGDAYCSGAFIALKNNQEVFKKSFKEEANFAPQIHGEMKACISAIDYAISLNEERVIIVYSNDGIEMWGNGSWAANKEQTKLYKSQIDERRKKINIDFVNAKQLSEEQYKLMKFAHKQAKVVLGYE